MILLATVLSLVFSTPFVPVIAQDNTHYLAFASDYHGVEGSIEAAMAGMPDNVEYVSLVGDMADHGRDRTPVYESADILAQMIGSLTVAMMGGDMRLHYGK